MTLDMPSDPPRATSPAARRRLGLCAWVYAYRALAGALVALPAAAAVGASAAAASRASAPGAAAPAAAAETPAAPEQPGAKEAAATPEQPAPASVSKAPAESAATPAPKQGAAPGDVNFDGAGQPRTDDVVLPASGAQVEPQRGPKGARLQPSTPRDETAADHGGAVPQADSAATPAATASAPAAPRKGFAQYAVQAVVMLAAPLVFLKFHGGVTAANALTVIGSFQHTAIIGSAVMGALTGFLTKKKAGASTASALGAAASGALAGAASTHVMLNVATMALNGFSVMGLNPVLTALAAVVLARTAISRLKDPTLSRGARVRAVLPAAAAALLLATQAILTLSLGSLPHVIAAGAIAATALLAVIQAARSQAGQPTAGASLMSWGLALQALMLGAAIAVILPSIAWPFVAAGGVGFLLSLAGAARAIFARRAPSAPPVQPPTEPAAPAAKDQPAAPAASPEAAAKDQPAAPSAQTPTPAKEPAAPIPAEKPKKAKLPDDAPYDARVTPLAPDDAQSMIITGHRFDEASGAILEPNGGKAMTVKQVRELENGLREIRSRTALLRLGREAAAGAVGGERWSALVAANRDILAPDILRASADDPQAAQRAVVRRLMSLYRRWLDKPVQNPPSAVRPVGGELEEKLGAVLADAAVDQLSEDPEGRRLLDELREESGALRLPTMRVLKLDERSGALYSSYGRQLIVSLDYLRARLVARLPEAERAEAASRMSNEKDALDYLTEKPERAALIAAAVDTTIFHELVHFKQDLTRSLMGAMLRQQVPGVFTLQHEFEAIYRQDLYIHSRLSRPGAALEIDRAEDYLRLIDDFDGWRAHVQDYYTTRLINGYGDVDEIVELQAQSRALIEALSASSPSAAAQAKRAGAAAGTDAAAREKEAAEGQIEGYRQDWEKLARAGLERWVELNAARGRWPQEALAYERLARLADARADKARKAHKASQPDAIMADSYRRSAGYARDAALMQVLSGEGLALDERLDWINALAADARERGTPWPQELWVAALRDQSAKVDLLRAEAVAAASEAEKKNLEALARHFEDTLKANRSNLLSYAENALPSIFDEAAPERAAFRSVWAETSAELGRWPQAAQAYERLAARATDDASAAALRAKAEDARNRALLRLAAPKGMSLDERLVWIAILAADYNGRGAAWKRELWLASQRDYELKIGQLKDEAARAKPRARAALERQAAQFAGILGANRAALRGFATTNLSAARAEKDADRRRRALEWGAMQAEMLGDAALIAEFKALAPAPAAPAPAAVPAAPTPAKS